MRRKESLELAYYQFDQFSALKHGVFTRKGGVSAAPWDTLNLGGSVGDDVDAVRRNHELIYAALDLCAEKVCSVWQIHSAEVIEATGPIQGQRWIAQADGMVTDCVDTPLIMRFADCTPLLFLDPIRNVIGIAHAGWRGTVAGIGAKTVEKMTETYGCVPRDIRVGIGPSISQERYQVGEEVVEAVQTYFGSIVGLVERDETDGTAYFDLWAANRLDLERAGVEQIEVMGLCTAERTDEFFSHRAEHGRTGRFGAVLSL
ncbi:MAG: peptidoglycan editing factor PgeF [Anaerolineae bacterium]